MAEHINSFEKGMTKDFNVLYQPDGTYRNMVNCSLISQDGNNFVIKDCLGNTRTFSINTRYLGSIISNDALPMAIGFISFPDKLIVFSTSDESEDGGYGEIGMLSFENYGEGIQPISLSGQLNPGYIPLYHSEDLLFSKMFRIEGFAYYETEPNQRVYWTDNNQEPRVFNIADPIYTTYFTTGSLVTGTRYMVLEGAITHGGTNYGPGITAGNIFTAVNANYTNLTGTSPTPKVIEYYPFELLSWSPDRLTGNIQFSEYGTGHVYNGSKIYFYRLGLNSQFTTPWSYGSAPVHTTFQQEQSIKVSNAYHDTVGGGNTSTLVDSTKSIKVTVDNIDTNYDFIELAVIEYDQLWDTPRSISIVDRQEITGSEMTLEHTGNINYGDLTLNDLTLFPASIKKCKTITTNKNFNLIANITERAEFTIDLTGVVLNSFNYPMCVMGDPDACSNLADYDNVSPLSGANPASGDIFPNARYKVVSGGTVTYHGHVYSPGDVFVGVDLFTGYTTTGTPVIRPCVTTNKYTPVGSSDRVENAIELVGSEATFWSYKSPAVAQHCKGYWSNEKYRFGILFFDKKGNPFYVKHLGDYTFPTIKDKGGLITTATYGGNDFFSLNPSGLNVSNLIIPVSLIDEISGFSIVRAERDPRIIAQGLVVQCSRDGGAPNIHRPIAFIQASQDANNMAPDTFSFICPDHLVDMPQKATFGAVGDTMETAGWLNPVPYTGSVYTKAVGGGEQIVSKLIYPLTGDSNSRVSTITLWKEYVEGQEESNFSGGSNTFQNTMFTGTSGLAPDPACIGGGVYNLDSRNAQGGKKCVFQTTPFLHYGPAAYNYTDTGATSKGNPRKILMNYCKQNTTQYGGTSPSALAATLYISTGHYQAIDETVKADTFNGVNYQFDNIEVFGGDCFTNLVDYGYGLWDDNLALPKYSYAWSFPCESSVNYELRRGRKSSNKQLYYTGTAIAETIVYYDPSANIRLEDYEYNQGYSTEGQSIKYPAQPVYYVSSGTFKFRARFAGPQIIGSLTDSFRTFLTGDYKDLDGNGGEINNIKVKDGRVITWQSKMVGTVPILERQAFSGADGAETTVGTGGVLDRFDPISSYYGNQHQWGLTETEYGFCWFDMSKKAFVVFEISGGITEVSQIEGLKSYFDEIFIESQGRAVDPDSILNSPTFAATSDRPLMGIGITGVYDPKFKMTYLTFKFKYQYPVSGNTNYLNKDFTIGYYHPRKMFIGFFDWWPSIAHNHNNFVIAANNPKNRERYMGVNMPSTTFEIGDTVSYSNYEFMCILGTTITSYPNLINPAAPTNDAVHWVVVNQTNELWVNNQPSVLGSATAPDYIYNKFFGRVVNNEVELIVNPKTNSAFNVQHCEQATPTNVNYTDIYIEAGSQTASDLSIKSWNKNFRYIYNMLCGSLPLSTTGRIVNNYLKIRLVKKNWTTNPTVVTTSTKILQFLKSFYIEKR